jgi:aryl-alcohol dehydrogenase-like predicted oxidoreductase
MPRFQGENWDSNQRLITQFAAIAREVGVTPAQLSLGWVLMRGTHIVVIPGTANIAHLEENFARADFLPDAATVARIDALLNQHTVAGSRYREAMQRSIDTEMFA